MMSNKYLIYGILFVVGFVVACSSLGTKTPYVPVKTIPEGQALVYIFYYGNKLPGSNPIGRSAVFLISDSGKPIVTLKRGGYYPYFVKPGELTLTSKLSSNRPALPSPVDLVLLGIAPTNTIKLKIDSGQTYYLEGMLYYSDVLDILGLKFNQIFDELQVQLSLEDCKLLSKYEQIDAQ